MQSNIHGELSRFSSKEVSAFNTKLTYHSIANFDIIKKDVDSLQRRAKD
jgi:hypothetical protein